MDVVPVVIESLAMDSVLVRMVLTDLLVNFAKIQINLEVTAMKLVHVFMEIVIVDCMAQDTANQTAVTWATLDRIVA